MPENAGFEIVGEVDFRPHYLPDTVRVIKERNLNREDDFCRGEDVTDTGSKNRDIHISGKMLSRDKQWFDILLDSNNVHTLVSTAWSGDVRVSNGEYEGPTQLDAETKEYIFKYKIDLVSTGRDEGSQGSGNGTTEQNASIGDSDSTVGITEE